MAPVLLQVDFPYTGPFGDGMTEGMRGLAESVAQEPGFLWKASLRLNGQQVFHAPVSGASRVGRDRALGHWGWPAGRDGVAQAL